MDRIDRNKGWCSIKTSHLLNSVDGKVERIRPSAPIVLQKALTLSKCTLGYSESKLNLKDRNTVLGHVLALWLAGLGQHVQMYKKYPRTLVLNLAANLHNISRGLIRVKTLSKLYCTAKNRSYHDFYILI